MTQCADGKEIKRFGDSSPTVFNVRVTIHLLENSNSTLFGILCCKVHMTQIRYRFLMKQLENKAMESIQFVI